jgi:hypothetical protein
LLAIPNLIVGLVQAAIAGLFLLRPRFWDGAARILGMLGLLTGGLVVGPVLVLLLVGIGFDDYPFEWLVVIAIWILYMVIHVALLVKARSPAFRAWARPWRYLAAKRMSLSMEESD